MAALSSALRNQLAAVIKVAQRQAEAGARKALEALAVHVDKPYGSMTQEERALRNRLRAHGRQLGDVRDRARGTQEIDRLAHEVAYEHWHRMLFARFLAENELLIEPDSGVAISIAECEELARERGEDPWALASRFAQRMLPRIFRPDDPVLEVTLAPETCRALERHLEFLPDAVFTSDDALGWTYQFWQAERKDAVNKAGVKIGADELPAVTQLFTEHYMVLFLFHNTIGAWWAGKLLAERPELAETARSEEELRRAVRVRAGGGYDFSYLRFVRERREGDAADAPTGLWRPAAGSFEAWPNTVAEIKVLDPCCGSGHFLVEGFELLVRLRMEEERLALEDAIRAALAENLFGLEIDARCTQIAAFNLALAAWKLAGRPIELPRLHIACSGLCVGASRDEWAKLAPDDRRLRLAMRWLYDEFQHAPVLGSLLDAAKSTAAKLIDWRELQPFLDQALERERASDEQVERAVAAQGMARAAEMLAGQYTLIITNVPYLGRGVQSDVLKAFADDHYKEAKADLATIFLSRSFRSLGTNGTAAVVTPQNWLFLTSYKKLREKLLALRTWNLVARLGPRAFETIGGHVVNVALTVISAGTPEEETVMGGLDASGGGTPPEKAALLRGDATGCTSIGGSNDAEPRMAASSAGDPPATAEDTASGEAAAPADGSVRLIPQAEQLANPDSRVAFGVGKGVDLLCKHAQSFHGLSSGDGPRIVHQFWEQRRIGPGWVFHQATVVQHAPWGGRHEILLWQDGSGAIDEIPGARKDGRAAWGRPGVMISQMSELACSLYAGSAFGQNGAVVIPHSPRYLPAVWAFCTSDEFIREVRGIDQALKVTAGTLVKVPFDLAHWQKVAAEKYPNGLPEPQSDDPTQWLFHGHPAKAEPAAALQVAVARLLGYRWPPEHDPEMRLADEARTWIERCRELDAFADEDGIVCLSATRGEAGAANRLRQLLAAAFGTDWSVAKERELLAAAAGNEKPAGSLEEWLRDRFFEEHCKLFHNRPFVWHIWDGRKDGFHALVSYHRLAAPDGEGRRTLEALTFSYLGDWITRQKAEQRDGVEGADARLAAAQDLQAQLEKILAGEPPCDLFVRWKPLHRQPIGWEPDINDGVRLNIRPFMAVELRKGGRKGAGILRWKPNITWKKDRGKEPRSLRPKNGHPWFWGRPGDGSSEDRTDFPGGSEFDGNRWNDLHYTVAAKQAARGSGLREGRR